VNLDIKSKIINDIDCEAKSGKKLEKKHLQIARAAAPLFIKKGYNNTSIREISKAVGMSMGNLYHYIKSKDDVLFLVYRELLYHVWEEKFNAVEIKKIEDPEKRLRALIQVTLQFVHENSQFIQMTFRESKFLEKSAFKQVLTIESQFIGVFVETIEDGINKGVFRAVEPNIVGNLISYNTIFLPLRGWFFKDSIPVDEIEQQVMDFIMGALLNTDAK
jgi:AcrR family transcriptional regulator